MNWKEYAMKWSWSNLKLIFWDLPAETEENHENLSG
jgi:hypothetical protein